MLKHDAEEDEENPVTMPKKIMKVLAQCQRTRNKKKGSNQSMIPKNPKQNEGIEFGLDVREPETKGKDRI